MNKKLELLKLTEYEKFVPQIEMVCNASLGDYSDEFIRGVIYQWQSDNDTEMRYLYDYMLEENIDEDSMNEFNYLNEVRKGLKKILYYFA